MERAERAQGGSDAPLKRAETVPPAERILTVAADLFCRDGIHATGIDRILFVSGVSKMTLYSHFGSKEALVHAVLEREGAAWRAWFCDAINKAAGDGRGRLAAIVPVLSKWFDGGRFYGCPFMNASAEHTKGESRLRALASAHHAELLAYLGGLARDAGSAEPAMLARQVLLLIDGAIAAMMVSGDPAVLDVSARTMDAILSSAQYS